MMRNCSPKARHMLAVMCLLMLSAAMIAQAATGRLLAPAKKGEKWGFIDTTGKFVIAPKYDHAYSFSDGFAAVEVDGKHGFIDGSGKYLVKPSFSSANPFSEGMAYVEKDGDIGFIDTTGHASYLAFDGLDGYFHDGLALAIASDQYGGKHIGYVGKDMEIAIDFPYDVAMPFSEGLAVICEYRKNWGYIDKQNKTVIPTRYDVAGSFSEGKAAVALNGKWRYIDKTGKLLFTVPFAGGMYNLITVRGEEFVADEFHCGRARVTTSPDGSTYGFIDEKGKLIVDGIRYGERFSEDLAAYQSDQEYDGAWGYLDKSGKPAIKPQYDEVMGFRNGFAVVRVGEKCGVIDKKGATIIKPQFDSMGYFSQAQ